MSEILNVLMLRVWRGRGRTQFACVRIQPEVGGGGCVDDLVECEEDDLEEADEQDLREGHLPVDGSTHC